MLNTVLLVLILSVNTAHHSALAGSADVTLQLAVIAGYGLLIFLGLRVLRDYLDEVKEYLGVPR